MKSSKLIFILFSLITFFIVPVLTRNARRYYLSLASFLNIFCTGWIFYHFTGLMLADLPILCLLAMGIFAGKKFNWKGSPIGGWIWGLIVCGIAASIGALQPGWSLAEVTKFIRMYLVMVVIAQNIRNISDLRLVVISMLSGLIFQALLGFYQNRYGSLGIWFLGERPPLRMDWRAMGTFYVPAYYANYIVTVLLVAYRLFVYYRAPSIKQSIFFGIAFAMGLAALVKSFARAPWIGFSIGFIITSLISFFRSKYKTHSRWAIPLFLACALLVSIKYHRRILDQFGTNRRTAYEVRFTQWDVAIRMLSARPLVGIGLFNYDQNSRNFMTVQEKESYLADVYATQVHNSYLLYSVELGLIGGVVFIIWFGAMIWTCILILRSKFSHPLITNLTMGILGGIIAFMVLLLTSPDIHEYSILYQLGLFSGILIAEWNVIRRVEWQKICSKRSGGIRPNPGKGIV